MCVCVCARAQSDCTWKTTEEEKEPLPRNKVNATGCVTWVWLLGPYEVTGSLSTYAIYAHTLTNTLLALLTPISVIGLPRPTKSGPSICPGPTGVNVLFTICLLAPNFHLSDWPVWLELRPEAEVHGEWLYCLALYLSLSGLENYSPPPPATTLMLGSQQQQKNGHCRGAERAVSYGHINQSVSHGLAELWPVQQCLDGAWAVFRFTGNCLNNRDVEGSSVNRKEVAQFWLACGSWIQCGLQKDLLLQCCLTKFEFCTCFETTNTTVSLDVLPLTGAAVSKRTNYNVSKYFFQFNTFSLYEKDPAEQDSKW